MEWTTLRYNLRSPILYLGKDINPTKNLNESQQERVKNFLESNQAWIRSTCAAFTEKNFDCNDEKSPVKIREFERQLDRFLTVWSSRSNVDTVSSASALDALKAALFVFCPIALRHSQHASVTPFFADHKPSQDRIDAEVRERKHEISRSRIASSKEVAELKCEARKISRRITALKLEAKQTLTAAGKPIEAALIPALIQELEEKIVIAQVRAKASENSSHDSVEQARIDALSKQIWGLEKKVSSRERIIRLTKNKLEAMLSREENRRKFQLRMEALGAQLKNLDELSTLQKQRGKLLESSRAPRSDDSGAMEVDDRIATLTAQISKVKVEVEGSGFGKDSGPIRKKYNAAKLALQNFSRGNAFDAKNEIEAIRTELGQERILLEASYNELQKLRDEQQLLEAAQPETPNYARQIEAMRHEILILNARLTNPCDTASLESPVSSEVGQLTATLEEINRLIGEKDGFLKSPDLVERTELVLKEFRKSVIDRHEKEWQQKQKKVAQSWETVFQAIDLLAKARIPHPEVDALNEKISQNIDQLFLERMSVVLHHIGINKAEPLSAPRVYALMMIVQKMTTLNYGEINVQRRLLDASAIILGKKFKGDEEGEAMFVTQDNFKLLLEIVFQKPIQQKSVVNWLLTDNFWSPENRTKVNGTMNLALCFLRSKDGSLSVPRLQALHVISKAELPETALSKITENPEALSWYIKSQTDEREATVTPALLAEFVSIEGIKKSQKNLRLFSMIGGDPHQRQAVFLRIVWLPDVDDVLKEMFAARPHLIDTHSSLGIEFKAHADALKEYLKKTPIDRNETLSKIRQRFITSLLPVNYSNIRLQEMLSGQSPVEIPSPFLNFLLDAKIAADTKIEFVETFLLDEQFLDAVRNFPFPKRAAEYFVQQHEPGEDVSIWIDILKTKIPTYLKSSKSLDTWLKEQKQEIVIARKGAQPVSKFALIAQTPDPVELLVEDQRQDQDPSQDRDQLAPVIQEILNSTLSKETKETALDILEVHPFPDRQALVTVLEEGMNNFSKQRVEKFLESHPEFEPDLESFMWILSYVDSFSKASVEDELLKSLKNRDGSGEQVPEFLSEPSEIPSTTRFLNATYGAKPAQASSAPVNVQKALLKQLQAMPKTRLS